MSKRLNNLLSGYRTWLRLPVVRRSASTSPDGSYSSIRSSRNRIDRSGRGAGPVFRVPALGRRLNGPTLIDLNTGAILTPPATPVASPFAQPRAFPNTDHEFHGFVGPLSNPVQFKDPRSLTEARFLFMNNFNKHTELGVAYEFQVSEKTQLLNNMVVAELIFRY